MTNSTRFNRRSFLLGLGSASTTLLLAACGQQQAAAPAVPAGGDSAASAGSAGGAKAEVARNETLVHYGGDTEVQEPTNFNPYSLGGLGRIRGPLNKTIFEFLYYYNHNDGAEIPWLAENYEVAEDYTSVNVTIRAGVSWNDGEPFTSEDVKFTLEKLRYARTGLLFRHERVGKRCHRP
ncbi:MAG: ABC transporter substrate-binding protein [Caldilineaceae bacterium]